MKKPPGLTYAVDESAPHPLVVLSGLQHVGLICINLVYPLLVFRAAGASIALTTDLLAIGLLVLAIATGLQVLRLGPVGSGFMCPATFTAAYFAPSLLAVKTGGLSLLFGMTMFAGALEAALGSVLNRLRPIFPSELSGLVIFMIGVSASIAALRSFLGANAEPVAHAEWWIAIVTLSSMVALNVWAKGLARMLCALLGVMIGYVAAAAGGLLQGKQFAAVAHAPWLGLPNFDHLSWSFDATLAAPFAVAAVAATMKAVGTITMCQRMNDAEWVRPDMVSATRGVMADASSTLVAGALGAVGTNTSTPSVGLASATGVASRSVGYAVAAIFLLLGLTPKAAALLAVMPRAVVVSALLFAMSFIIINGLQVMTSRLLDARRTLVIGLSIVAGVAVEAFPLITAAAPRTLVPLIASSLAFSTLVALVLNLLFRIGIRKTVSMSIPYDHVDPQVIEDFFKSNGSHWGARPDVIARATFGAVQLVDAIRGDCWLGGAITLTVSFDEFNLDVRMKYEGEPLGFPEERPTNREIVASDAGSRRLAGYMLRRSADLLRSSREGSLTTVHLHYEH